MRILHVILGFPPLRTGGLTQYSISLIKEQLNIGHKVFALYAGNSSLSGKLSIQRDNKHIGCKAYYTVNPLPVAIPFGIREPQVFMAKAQCDIYTPFLKSIKPDMIHVHTIMGIHKEFFVSAKKLNIPIIFTTHDYFGLCVKTNFVNQNGELCKEAEIKKCALCNMNSGIPALIARFLQTDLYGRLKETGAMKIIRRLLGTKMLHKQVNNTVEPCDIKYKEYYFLYEYYHSIFRLMDAFHFNSSVSRKVYERHLGNISGKVMNITHDGIADKRGVKKLLCNPVRVGYIGSALPYKGIGLLTEAMVLIKDSRCFEWELHLYGDDFSKEKISLMDNVYCHGRYNRHEFAQIMQSLDVLVVPSICNETFGFVVLEALSYGVPVLVSGNVGAKDLLVNAPCEVVFLPDKNALAKALVNLMTNNHTYEQYVKWILQSKFVFQMKDHVKFMEQYYQEILSDKGVKQNGFAKKK